MPTGTRLWGFCRWGSRRASPDRFTVTRARLPRPSRRRSLFSVVILASLLATLVPLLPIPVSAASNYNTTVLADAPAAYWRVGEAAGTTMTDATANANNGTYAGGFTLGQTGAIVGDP